MSRHKIQVIWSKSAMADLKHIFEHIKEKTKSVELANNTKVDILNASKQLVFTEQYQVEEILGEPYRRILVRHYKLVYKPHGKSQIRILKIFDTFKNPDKLKEIT
jgi:plasmid stabilization system protein ParE